jgi:hypothetical protein
VRYFLSGHFIFTQISRFYKCSLILRSRAVDPLRTAGMIDGEEKVRQHFENLKHILPELSPFWERDFKHHIEEFIEDRLNEREFVMIPKDKEGEEHVRDRLHELRRLVAGAVQEWELVQQPKHAATCAKLDGALVWQGRGYVCPILHLFSCSDHLCRVNLIKFRQRYGW